VGKEPFGNIPKGPLQIIVSVDQQELHLYSDGIHVAATPVATGVADHPTPLGVFSIIQKSRYHRSNIYSDAPMPYMQRITWSGIALHEGRDLGHPASHGCVRMSHDFATRLWALTKLGARVIIARSALRLEKFADPHLFVHTTKPIAPLSTASTSAAPLTANAFKTAQTGEDGNITDAPREEGRDAAAAISPVGAATDPDASAAAAVIEGPRRNEPSAALDTSPIPPSRLSEFSPASKAPIAIFVSRKNKRIYVRQDFAPLFDAPITVAQPEQPLGTHVFTAMEYLEDHATLRWNVISLPGEQPKTARQTPGEKKSDKHAENKRRGERAAKRVTDPPPPQSPEQALARIEIPQDVIDQISQLIVPGSSLIISDQGLGEETGEGTDFIVVTR
jgi:hypothetical protein